MSNEDPAEEMAAVTAPVVGVSAPESSPVPVAERRPTDLVIGRLAAVFPELRVQLGDDGRAIAAASLAAFTVADEGCAVAVSFIAGDSARPIVLGRIVGNTTADAVPAAALPERVLIEAGKEIVLRTGAASISLGADGRISIRGSDVSSRATHANRIRGAGVHIN